MDAAELERLSEQFATFHRRYAPLFGGWEAQDRSAQYLQGLLVCGRDRRNAENLADQVDGATPRALQRFLTESPWRVDWVIERLQEDVAEVLEHPDAVFVVDETGFPKQGTKSVGVARQYSGTLGKVGNCQIGVFLGYASEAGHALIDGRLYLPTTWTDDPDRCREAGVPEDVVFQTKPELALAMLRQARARGHLQARWVTGDEVYGGNPAFRDALDQAAYWYVLEVPRTTLVSPMTASSPPPDRPPGLHVRDDVHPPTTVAALAETIPPAQWQLLEVAAGAQGPRVYQFAQQRVREVRAGRILQEATLLFRRNPDGNELRSYLANTPATLSLLTLGRVAATRWTIETGFEQAKGETGLDEYEVRRWQGWGHHMTLALLAGLFLLQLRMELGGKSGRADDPPSGLGAPGTAAPHPLDHGNRSHLAEPHPTAERRRRPLPRQTSAA